MEKIQSKEKDKNADALNLHELPRDVDYACRLFGADE
jgi:hypothetical protein